LNCLHVHIFDVHILVPEGCEVYFWGLPVYIFRAKIGEVGIYDGHVIKINATVVACLLANDFADSTGRFRRRWGGQSPLLAITAVLSGA
jgi:hypothetical protein